MSSNDYHGKNFFSKYQAYAICLFLVGSTLAVYWQVQQAGFVTLDDNQYITVNSRVKAGLTIEGVRWAFTTTDAANWHPLTWLSHMLDCHLFGENPGWHHLTNLFFHVVNTVLLFAVFRKMTGQVWQSGLVAALFALHPLHVESVAWISERKDVLSTFFWILTMWHYSRWVKYGGSTRYLVVLLCFALGLMAKPMLVTLPFVLLLLDYWPLGRIQGEMRNSKDKGHLWRTFRALTWEKMPLFTLTATSSVVTFIVQKHGGAVESLQVLPIMVRIGNAITAYLQYVLLTIWPTGLAPIYPYTDILSFWKVALALLFLAAISWFAMRNRGRQPYLAVGWLWFVGTLVPVIGIVQVGLQSIADRYTYVPLIGLFIMVAWGISSFISRWSRTRAWVFTALGLVLLIFMVLTWKQVRYWKNSVALFEHTLEVTSNNFLAHNSLGVAMIEEGRTEHAIEHYSEALRINPLYELAHYNLGYAAERAGRTEEAMGHYLDALRIKPNFAAPHFSLGNLLADQNQPDKAIKHYSAVLKFEPENEKAHCNLGNVLAEGGRLQEAREHYLVALRINPDYGKAHYGLGNVLASQGRTDEALEHYNAALRADPDHAEAHYNKGILLFANAELDQAIYHFRAFVRVKPDHKEALNNLGYALYRKGDMEEAAEHFRKALQIDPGYDKARNNLDKVLNMARQ